MPTEKELIDFAVEEEFLLFCDEDDFVQIAQALLQRFAPVSLEVAQLQARVAELEAALADEREKSAFWAEKAHEMRGQALRGETVDGIIQP